jgi:hypothetical protein
MLELGVSLMLVNDQHPCAPHWAMTGYFTTPDVGRQVLLNVAAAELAGINPSISCRHDCTAVSKHQADRRDATMASGLQLNDLRPVAAWPPTAPLLRALGAMLLLLGVHVPLGELFPRHMLLIFILVPVGGAVTVWGNVAHDSGEKKGQC